MSFKEAPFSGQNISVSRKSFASNVIQAIVSIYPHFLYSKIVVNVDAYG